MEDVRWERRGAMAFVLGGWLLASCTLVDRYGLAPGDAGAVTEEGDAETEPVQEYEDGDLRSGARVDAARPSPGSRPHQDANPGRDAATEEGGLSNLGGEFQGASGNDPDGHMGPDGGPEGAEASPTGTKDAGPVTPMDREPDAGQVADDGGALPDDTMDAGMPADDEAEEVAAMLDAILAVAAERIEMYCSCPANAQECSREGFGDESCVEEGLSAASGISDDAVRELLSCWLPAEEEYTNCIARELDCEAVQASIRACTRDHKIATDRCNDQSLIANSLRIWC